MTGRHRIVVAALAVVLLAGAAIGYIRYAAARSAADTLKSGAAQSGAVSLAPGARLAFRSTAPDSLGHLATVAFDVGSSTTVDNTATAAPRAVAALVCTRLYAAGGTGVCLRPDGPLSTYQLLIVDAALRQVRAIPLVGVPNRARVSASGRMVAWTVFVTGDSYNGGAFSTRAGILDLRTGELAGSLEEFAVTRNGRPYQAADLNFWGVSFAADDNRFYATMSTAGHRYLVEGDFAAKTVRTLRENVECPSLSPDGTRVAYKSAVDGDPDRGWRLSVLDLATMRTTALAERRGIDDQAAWLDDQTVAYAVRRTGEHADIWAVPADGGGAPRLLVPEAESPAVLS